MWGMPVLSLGGVRKVIPKTLFSSAALTDTSSAPKIINCQIKYVMEQEHGH